jgi:hypothetical protein
MAKVRMVNAEWQANSTPASAATNASVWPMIANADAGGLPLGGAMAAALRGEEGRAGAGKASARAGGA